MLRTVEIHQNGIWVTSFKDLYTSHQRFGRGVTFEIVF